MCIDGKTCDGRAPSQKEKDGRRTLLRSEIRSFIAQQLGIRHVWGHVRSIAIASWYDDQEIKTLSDCKAREGELVFSTTFVLMNERTMKSISYVGQHTSTHLISLERSRRCLFFSGSVRVESPKALFNVIKCILYVTNFARIYASCVSEPIFRRVRVSP